MKDGSEIIPTTFDNRENLLFKLEEVIDYLYNKALNGRDGHVDVIKNYDFINDRIKELIEKFDDGVKKLNDHIWTKQIKEGFTYYSPERVFIYEHLYPDKISSIYLLEKEKLRV